MLRSCLIAGLLLFATSTRAIEGQYTVSGSTPGGQGRYVGEAAVKKVGDVYAVVWKIGSETHFGTGVVKDRVFSVVYRQNSAGARPGVAAYSIVDDQVRDGVWTQLGAQQSGMETWTRVGTTP